MDEDEAEAGARSAKGESRLLSKDLVHELDVVDVAVAVQRDRTRQHGDEIERWQQLRSGTHLVTLTPLSSSSTSSSDSFSPRLVSTYLSSP